MLRLLQLAIDVVIIFEDGLVVSIPDASRSMGPGVIAKLKRYITSRVVERGREH
jgi:hypothetical protein